MTHGRVVVHLARAADPWVPTRDLLTALAPDERLAARDRPVGPVLDEFVRSRALRRAVLSDAMGVAADELTFVVDADRKPSVPGGPAFNVSHTEGLTVVAVAAEHRHVGVDVEAVVVFDALARMARRYLPPADAARSTGAGEESVCHFFEAWTRLEAAVKAGGGGLSVEGIDAIATSLGGNALTDVSAVAVRVREAVSRFELQTLPVPAPWVGALCADAPFRQVVRDVPARLGEIDLLV